MSAEELKNAKAGEGATREPEEIRAEIESTRDELGETVEALAAKTDVKSQAKAKVEAAKETARTKLSGAQETAQQKLAGAQEAAPPSVSAGGQQAAAAVRENPVPSAAVGALVAGLVIGWMFGRRG